MKRNLFATLMFLLVMLFAVPVKAQAPVATPQEAVVGLLNRIGGKGAALGNLLQLVGKSLAAVVKTINSVGNLCE